MVRARSWIKRSKGDSNAVRPTNASAVAGLESASRIARTLGNAPDAVRWEARAKAIREAMAQKLVAPGGYWARGLKGTFRSIDERLEIGNLALGSGGFALYPDTDPRLAKVGDLVKERLLTPNGGVKRYEGDRYYGGQPWPVAAAWLAIHELARGAFLRENACQLRLRSSRQPSHADRAALSRGWV